METSATHSSAPPSPPARSASGFRLVATLFAISAVLGVIAFWRYTQSERALVSALTRMAQRGAGLDAEGCVGETLIWNKSCEAMKTLCDASVPRMMETCLRRADRSVHCRKLGDRVMATQYGVAECKARGRSRRDKPCALAYRAIATHCERLRLGTALTAVPPELARRDQTHPRVERRGGPSR